MELINRIQKLYNDGKQRRDDMIQAALNASYEMLPIKAFIEITEFKLNDILPFDLMWNSFERDIPIYVNNDLIKVFGYKGLIYDQKKHILNLVKKYNISVIQLKNEEYEEFTGSLTIENLYPQITKEQLKSKPLHTLIMPKDLKLLLMVVNTTSGHFARKYYLEIEELFQTYLFYQCEFYKKLYKKEIRKIYELPHIKYHNKLLKLEKLEMEIYQRYKIGVIYFICEEDNENIVKIGYTFNLPDRLCCLQTAHYKKLIVKDYYFTQFPAVEEKRVHEMYKSSNIRGEWYYL